MLDVARVRQAATTLLDLAAAWEVSQARASPAARDARREDSKALRKVVAQVEAYAAGATRDVASLALPLLVEELASLYQDVVDGRLTKEALRGQLRDAWSALPAARILGRRLSADEFADELALEAGAKKSPERSISGYDGPKKAALRMAAGLLGRSVRTGFKLNKRSDVSYPFDVEEIAALRLRYTLALLFPDVEPKRLSEMVLVAAKGLRASTSSAPGSATTSSWMPWPSRRVAATLRAEGGSARAIVVAEFFHALGGEDEDARWWAWRRYISGESVQRAAKLWDEEAEAEYRRWGSEEDVEPGQVVSDGSDLDYRDE